MPKVYVQKWIERETDWGERPDGYSLHFQLGDIPKFIEQIDQAEAEYLAKAREIDPGAMLNICDYPSGEPFEREVDEETYQKVLASGFGLKVDGKWSELDK